MSSSPSKLLSLKTEHLLLSIGVASFLGYIAFSYYDSLFQIGVWPFTLASLCLLLGTLSHYIYTLVKILMVQQNRTKKIVLFLGVLVLGHIGAWLYTLFVSPQEHIQKVAEPPTGKKRRSITDRIVYARIFKPITSKLKAFREKESSFPDND